MSIEMEDTLARLDEDIQKLTEKISSKQNDRQCDIRDFDSAKSAEDLVTNLRVTRNLEGHFGKIYSMQWGPDSKHIVSAGQDGKLIVWQAHFNAKLYMINLRSSWVMCCAFSPDGKYVASGGLDNICSIYKIPDNPEEAKEIKEPNEELAQHLGYLSCIRYIDDSRMLTSSGDSSIILWDLKEKQPVDTFNGHRDDVMCVCLMNDNPNVFVSGSVDCTAKLWDIRTKKSVLTFWGHQSDVNCVAPLPGGNSFVSACEDAAIRIFDIRAQACLGLYSQVECDYKADMVSPHAAGVTSVASTKSGRGIVASYDHETVLVWDTLKGKVVQELREHESRVAAVDVSPDGTAICTASWDNAVKVWA